MTTGRHRPALMAAALILAAPGVALAQAAVDDAAAALAIVNDRCQPNVQATADTLQVRYGDSGPAWRLDLRAFDFDYFAGGVRATCRDDVAMGRCGQRIDGEEAGGGKRRYFFRCRKDGARVVDALRKLQAPAPQSTS